MINQKKIAVAIPTKNNIRTIEETLKSIKGLSDYLLIIDSGSTDGTIELCETYGAEIIAKDWPGMVKQRQLCIDSCRDYDWILLLDSDESIDEELKHAIQNVVAVNDSSFDAYAFNRKIWFLDGWLHNVFQPEFRLRLVRGGVAKVEGKGEEGKGGHDRIEVKGKVGKINGTCKHDSWVDTADMMNRYVELGKRAALYDPKPTTKINLLINPLSAFIKQYFIKGGIKDGHRGFVASAGCAAGTLIKHLLKISNKNRE